MALTLNTNGFLAVGANFIHCSNLNFDPGITNQAIETDGYLAPSIAVALQAIPKFTFTSPDVKGCLSNITLLGKAMTGASVAAYLQTLKSEGTRETNAEKWALTYGIITLDTISAAQGGVATVNGSATIVSEDGYTAGYTISNTTLPTFTPQDKVLTLGSVTLGGTAIVGVTQVTINPGIEVITNISDGNYYPTFAAQMSLKPTIQITVSDYRQLATILGDKNVACDDLVVRLSETDCVIEEGAAVTITANKAQLKLDTISNSQGQVSNATLTATVTFDGTNAPLVVS